MTRKERFERALRCEEVDRLPFWAKIFGPSYRALQEQKVRDMPELELADYLELDHMAGGPSPVRGRNSRTTQRSERRNGTMVITTDTPDGQLRAVNGFDPGSHSWHPIEFPVKSRNDLRTIRHCYEHTTYELDQDALEKCHARLTQVGDRGIVMCGMGVSPLMDLIQHLIGPEQTYYYLADHPEEMDELIEIMHQDRLRYLRVLVEHVPYQYVMSVENTSTTLLSPRVFEQYPRRHLREYGEIITEAGKTHLLHQCGKLKALLPRIDDLPASAIEAYTTPPVGNTTLADRAALASGTAIIGGTNAALWLRSSEEICAAIEADIALAGGIRGVVLTSAGVMPPSATIDKIARVRDWARTVSWS